MTKNPIVFDLFNETHFSEAICTSLGYIPGKSSIHHFPDEEILINIETPVKNKSVLVIASLDRPNNKIATLVFAAETLRELGANKIILIAPYLAYMRQDIQFHEGEGITSKYFAKLLSTYFDALITIDPHLHRWHSLSDIFTIPTTLLHATQAIADWINKNVSQAVLIGPDRESTQWVAEIAKISGIPYLIVEKTRKGDTEVSATIPQLELYPNHHPIIIDDIISTGVTLIETIHHIQAYGIKSITCIGVHAIFANDAYQRLLKTGIKDIVTCNTITHPSNQIDLSQLIIKTF
jgi:ribose-phosphate pyrophosphokinase